MKRILFDSDARRKIKAGIDKCCDVVKVSMGGHGKNVLIYNGQTTEIINDGVSIARAIDVKDEIEQAGIQLAKQCAQETDLKCKDGTTTTLVLLQAILNEIIKPIQTFNPRLMREQLFREANQVLDTIKPTKIKTAKDVYNLALTSSLDQGVAQLMKEIHEELGEKAMITIEESDKNILEKEITKGIQFDSKDPDKMFRKEGKQILEDVDVAVLDKASTSSDIKDFVSRAVNRDKKELVVIANQFERPLLMEIMATRDFKIVPVEYALLKPIGDLMTYVGDKPVKKIIIEEGKTTVIEGQGDTTELLSALKEKLANAQSTYDKEELEGRISGLESGLAIIRVGKATDVERIESVKKIEDAIGAVKGAYECGYVKGAGKALSETASTLELSEAMQNICQAPFKQICKNAGEELEIPEGVIDSFKTVKHSLLNALSTATSIMTVEAALIELEEETK